MASVKPKLSMRTPMEPTTLARFHAGRIGGLS